MEEVLKSIESGDSREILSVLQKHFKTLSEEDKLKIYLALKDQLGKRLTLPSTDYPSSKGKVFKNRDEENQAWMKKNSWSRQRGCWFAIGFRFVYEGIGDAKVLVEEAILDCFRRGDIKIAELLITLSQWPPSLLFIVKEGLVFLDINPVLKQNIIDSLKNETEFEYSAYNLLLKLGEYKDPCVEEIIVEYFVTLILNNKVDKMINSFDDIFGSMEVSLPGGVNKQLLTSLSEMIKKEEIIPLKEIVDHLHDKVLFVMVDKIHFIKNDRGERKPHISQFVIEDGHVKAIAIINFVFHEREDSPSKRFGLRSIPSSIGNLKLLEELRIENFHDDFTFNIPNSFKELKSLKFLELSNIDLKENITKLMEILSNLDKLTRLILDKCNLGAFPNSLTNLSNLKELSLSNNLFHELPQTFINLNSLKVLVLDGNYLAEFVELQEMLRNFTNLEFLSLDLYPKVLGGMRKEGAIKKEEEDRVLIKFEGEENEQWIPKSDIRNLYAPLPNLQQEFQLKSH